MWDLYTGNYNTLIKEIKEVTNKYKDNLCSWITRQYDSKMSLLPKVMHRFMESLAKSQRHFLTGIEKKILKITWNYRPNVDKIIKKEEPIWVHHTSWCQITVQSYNNKRVWHWHKDRCIDQWNRIKVPQINLHIYSQLIFNKLPWLHKDVVGCWFAPILKQLLQLKSKIVMANR